MTRPALHPDGTDASTAGLQKPDGAPNNGTATIARAGDAAGATILGLFAIPLGVAGLGGVWQALRTTVSAPAWPAEICFGISTALWLGLTVAYLASGIRRSGGFTADRKHAIYGPFAAYIPIIGVLLAAHYQEYARTLFRAAVVVFVVALAIIAAQLLAHWLLGNLPVATFHPGYFLPIGAGPFIASIGLSSSGWHQAAQSAFGVGVFFWISIGTLIFGRLFTSPPLPDILKPSLSVLVSPPATAGIAWLLIAGGQLDILEYVLLGVLFMMIFIQVLFFAEYRRLLHQELLGLQLPHRRVDEPHRALAQRRAVPVLARLGMVPGRHRNRLHPGPGRGHPDRPSTSLTPTRKRPTGGPGCRAT